MIVLLVFIIMHLVATVASYKVGRVPLLRDEDTFGGSLRLTIGNTSINAQSELLYSSYNSVVHD